jgi:hypothetical protein
MRLPVFAAGRREHSPTIPLADSLAGLAPDRPMCTGKDTFSAECERDTTFLEHRYNGFAALAAAHSEPGLTRFGYNDSIFS